MRAVTAYVTADNRYFNTFTEARLHADNRFYSLVDRLAHQAIAIEKYTDMRKWIEANLSSFSALLALKADCAIEGISQREYDDEED